MLPPQVGVRERERQKADREREAGRQSRQSRAWGEEEKLGQGLGAEDAR